MSDRLFTEPQLRALMFLPADGSWLTKAGRMSAACDSLQFYHRDLCESSWEYFGARGGWAIAHRLTSAGIAERQRREQSPPPGEGE